MSINCIDTKWELIFFYTSWHNNKAELLSYFYQPFVFIFLRLDFSSPVCFFIAWSFWNLRNSLSFVLHIIDLVFQNTDSSFLFHRHKSHSQFQSFLKSLSLHSTLSISSRFIDTMAGMFCYNKLLSKCSSGCYKYFPKMCCFLASSGWSTFVIKYSICSQTPRHWVFLLPPPRGWRGSPSAEARAHCALRWLQKPLLMPAQPVKSYKPRPQCLSGINVKRLLRAAEGPSP